MILHIEQEILLDLQCRDLYLCNNDLNDEYLVIPSSNQCSCKKQQAILCKSDHDTCQKRCLLENILFIKQKNQSNNILINNYPTKVVLLTQNELEDNREIVYICHGNNLPRLIGDHLTNQLNCVNNLSINRVLLVD